MKNLKASALLKSRNGNRYLLDNKQKKTLLCHPLLYFILNEEEEGHDLMRRLREMDKSGEDIITVDGYGPASKEELRYYYQKFLMLKENGYFESLNPQGKLSRRLSAEDVKRSLANPPIITFEVTDGCSLDCKYCGYGKLYTNYDTRENKKMDVSSAKQLLDYLLELWNSPLNVSHDRSIYIGFYGGEPLMNFPFIKEITTFLSSAKVLHNRFNFSMTTNALLLSKYMDFLAEHDFNLLISLDGNMENTGYRVTKSGKNAFPLIMENVDALRSKYPGYFERKVNFNAVIHNRNSIPEVFHFFKENFNKFPSLGALNTNGINEEHKEEFWKTYSNMTDGLYNSEDYSMVEQEMFIKLPNIQSLTTFIHKKTDFSFNDYNGLLYPQDKISLCPTGTCAPFTRKVFVTVNGKIMACERISPVYKLGDVDAQGVHIDFEAAAEKYNRWYDKMEKQCSVCYNADLCAQCLFYLP
ncbi:MAG: radical SAM peptide maturase, partial [bacterium]|nr:radical SAM peptide maturase [bacterium]